VTADWANVTWICAVPGCGVSAEQRFHVPTDGDPKKATPPAPWSIEETQNGPAFICPECSKHRAAEQARRDDLSAAYANIPRETAEAIWAEAHLCLRCAHSAVCRFAPDSDGAAILVTISRCGAFIFVPDSA